MGKRSLPPPRAWPSRRSPLTAEEAQAVAAIYDIFRQQGVDPAFAAAEFPLREKAFTALNSTTPPPALEGEEPAKAFRDRILEWGTLDEQGKQQLLRDAAALVDEAYGLPADYKIEFAPPGYTGPYGQYRIEKSQKGSGRLILDLPQFNTDGADAIAMLLHELEHVYQAALMRDVAQGKIGREDPRYRQIELFILSQGFYDKVSGPVRAKDAYYDDPREGHSQQAYKAWLQFWGSGTIESD